MHHSDILHQSLYSRDRICPMLASSAIVKKGNLSLRLGDERVLISAPPKYLEKLLDWCQGDKSLSDITVLSEIAFGCSGSDFMNFIKDLLNSSVLIDAALHVATVASLSTTLGKRVDEVVWHQLAEEQRVQKRKIEGAEFKFNPLKNTAFHSNLEKRHSAKKFINHPISLDHLVLLLHAAYGTTGNGRRTVASAGGFYSLEIILTLLSSVESVNAGTYRVSFTENGSINLSLIGDSLDLLPRLTVYPKLLRNAAGFIVISTDLRLATMKYRNLAYSYALLEAGAVIQNIALSAAELGLGWRPLGITEKASIEKFTGLYSPWQQALIAGVFGVPDSETASINRELAIEFGWVDNLPELPFEMAMARIKATDSAKPLPFSWGRATNPKLAYDKALGEAVERYAYNQLGKCVKAIWGDMPNMYDPRLLTGYTANQYKAKGFPFSEFVANKTYLWTEVTGVFDEQPWWVPAEYIFSRSALPFQYAERPLASANSSGCASGTSVKQAQSSALFEVIERDAFMRHWLAQRGGIKIEDNGIPAELAKRIRTIREKSCKIDLHLLDLGIEPVWMFFAQDEKCGFTAVSSGSGLDAIQALESALMEVETAIYSRWAGLPVEAVHPSAISSPHQHAELYAQKRYFRRADALNSETGKLSFKEAIRRFPLNIQAVYQKLEALKFFPLWADMTVTDAPCTFDGERIYSGRILVPGLVPLYFGTGNLPLAMDKYKHRRARFPHPFP